MDWICSSDGRNNKILTELWWGNFSEGGQVDKPGEDESIARKQFVRLVGLWSWLRVVSNEGFENIDQRVTSFREHV
jgi:hypothetical protein